MQFTEEKVPVNKEGEKPLVSLVSHQTAACVSVHGDVSLQRGCRSWASSVGDNVKKHTAVPRKGGICRRTPHLRSGPIL